MLELALELGADECITTADGHEFSPGWTRSSPVREALEAMLGRAASGCHHLAARPWSPSRTISRSIIKMIEVLDDHDDVRTLQQLRTSHDALMPKLAS